MKKIFSRILTILLVGAFLLGAGLLAYPYAADLYNKWQSSQVSEKYDASSSAMSSEQTENLLAQARAYNQELLERPDRYHPDESFHQQYMDTLNIDGSGLMGTVTIPKIDVKLPVYHTTDENVLQNAAGHIEGTSLPVGGEGTHAVISGHTGLPSAKLLTDLDQLALGDLFTLTVLNQKMTYEIDDISVVLPEEADKLAISPDKDEVTLLTCTPYGINSHRLLIKGHRIENPKEDYLKAVDETGQFDWKILALAAAAIGIVVILVLLLKKPKKNQN